MKLHRRGSEIAEMVFSMVCFVAGFAIAACSDIGYDRGVRDHADGLAVVHEMPDGRIVVVKVKKEKTK